MVALQLEAAISDFVDYYQILGVDKLATDVGIRRRYIELAKQHHPDVGGSDNQMRLVNEAYAALRGTARAEYDRRYDLHYETDDMQQYVDDIEEYVQQAYAAPTSSKTGYGLVPRHSPFGRVLKFALGASVIMVIGIFGVGLASALNKGGTTSVAVVSSTDKGVAPTPLMGITVPEYVSSDSRSTAPPAQSQAPVQNQPASVSQQTASQPNAVTPPNTSPRGAANASDLPGGTCRSLKYPHRHVECPMPAADF